MLFKVTELFIHEDIKIYEIGLSQVELVRKGGKEDFIAKKNGWDMRILTPLNPIHHPEPEISDIIKINFDPKYTFNSKLGKYEPISEFALKGEEKLSKAMKEAKTERSIPYNPIAHKLKGKTAQITVGNEALKEDSK